MPECGLSELIEAGKCVQMFDRHRRRAVKVFAMVEHLEAIGGTAYTPATLNAAAQEFCPLSSNPDQLNVAWITFELNNAEAAGASIDTDPQALAASIKCWEQYPDWKLTLFEALLRCELGPAAPQ